MAATDATEPLYPPRPSDLCGDRGQAATGAGSYAALCQSMGQS